MFRRVGRGGMSISFERELYGMGLSVGLGEVRVGGKTNGDLCCYDG